MSAFFSWAYFSFFFCPFSLFYCFHTPFRVMSPFLVSKSCFLFMSPFVFLLPSFIVFVPYSCVLFMLLCLCPVFTRHFSFYCTVCDSSFLGSFLVSVKSLPFFISFVSFPRVTKILTLVYFLIFCFNGNGICELVTGQRNHYTTMALKSLTTRRYDYCHDYSIHVILA